MRLANGSLEGHPAVVERLHPLVKTTHSHKLVSGQGAYYLKRFGLQFL